MMNHHLPNMKRNDDAISPVIGTILMVAATVIIAGAVYAAVNTYNGKTAKATPDAGFKAQALDTDGNGLEDMIKVTYLSGNSGLAANATVTGVADGISYLETPTSKTSWSAGEFESFAIPAGTYFVTVRAGESTLLDQTLTVKE